MNKNARRCVFFVQSVKYEKLDFALWCKNVYSYFKKRCQKKSKHPISQDPKVVWVVSNRPLLLQLKGSSRSHDDDAEDND